VDRGPSIHRIAGVRGANAWLVTTGEGLVIVDTGLPGNGRRVLEFLSARGHAAGDVRAVVLTHADPDHAGSAAELRELTGVPVAIHAHDAHVLAGGLTPRRAKGPLRARSLPGRLARLGHELGMAIVLRAGCAFGWRALRADRLLRDGDVVAGLRVIHAPGHTAGSIALARAGRRPLRGGRRLRGRAGTSPLPAARDGARSRAGARLRPPALLVRVHRAVSGPRRAGGEAGDPAVVAIRNLTGDPRSGIDPTMVASGNDRSRRVVLETTGALLRDVARLHVRAQREQVSCCGTTVAQCHILTELGRAGPLPLTGLGRRLGLHKGWISRAVASLVADGLVERGGVDGDERVVVLSLSRAGERRVQALDETLNRHAARLLGRIAPSDREHVCRALALVRSALREELGADDEPPRARRRVRREEP
jgi:DNA-binding MarR family transcriptional regulator